MTHQALAIKATNPSVFINDGKAVTTSQSVAEYFAKRHDNVIQKIERLECSKDFHLLNFKVMSKNIEIGNGATRESKIYQMTKDGFVFLVMGFTGKKAAQFKEAYIAEFNRMEAELYGNKLTPDIPREELDTYNVNALAKHYEAIYTAWISELHPALLKLNSPLAGHLYDRFKDGYSFLKRLHRSLNGKHPTLIN